MYINGGVNANINLNDNNFDVDGKIAVWCFSKCFCINLFVFQGNISVFPRCKNKIDCKNKMFIFCKDS